MAQFAAVPLDNCCDVFKQKENTVQAYGLGMGSIAEVLQTSLSGMQGVTAASFPQWTIKQPNVLLDLDRLPEQKGYTHSHSRMGFTAYWRITLAMHPSVQTGRGVRAGRDL